MLVYILPVALFVITMIIILALRAEDKKSRSLSNVKEKIVTFRNEASQTVKRVQETCLDSIDKIQSKQNEVSRVINDIDLSLENLKNHKRDLAALESICKSYEVTLEKLRLQTEHAENRISVVQDEVRKAESVNSTIESFKSDAAVIEEDIVRQQESVKAYLATTRVNLDAIVQEHQDKEREMLSLFSDELSKNREEFGSYLDEARADLALKRKEADSQLADAIASLSEKEEQITNGINGRLDEIESKKAELSTLFDQRSEALKNEEERLNTYYLEKDKEAEALLEKYQEKLAEDRDNFDSFINDKNEEFKNISSNIESNIDERRKEAEEFFQNERNKLLIQVDNLTSNIESRENQALDSLDERIKSVKEEANRNEESILNARENLSIIYTQLEEKLNSAYNTLFEQLKTLEQSVNDKVSELSLKRDEIENRANEVKSEVTASFDSTLASLSESFEKTKKELSLATEDSIKALNTKQREVEDACLKGSQDISAIHQKEFETMDAEAKAFIEQNKVKIAEILNSEVTRIDGVYRAMNKIALETIENLANRQLDIKESVSWLNQGADETIANTVERLNDLQRKIADKQAQLEETQKRVTETKEELFNLTEQNREVNRELLAITDKFESEQKRLDSIKKERMDEEAMLVRKKIENDNKPASTPLSAPKSKKSQVTIESFPDDFLLGEEEDLLSED